MSSMRAALLIATDAYSDSTFSQLRAPRHDAGELARVLGDRRIGDFDVEVLSNRPSHEIRMRIEELFAEAARDDFVLLYVSGHGVKDGNGQLQLATADTRHNRIASTAVSAQFVREQIDASRARKVVVWLDCCYSGGFPSGAFPKAGGDVDVLGQLSARSGRGCAVMTASTHTQYAFELNGDAIAGVAQESVFTSGIVAGLRTGDADLNRDGEIDASELYDYVYDWVKERTPGQTPTRNDQVTGQLYIAHSGKGLWLPAELPAEIRQGLRSSLSSFRDAAVNELRALANTGDAVAKATLRRVAAEPQPADPQPAAPPRQAAPPEPPPRVPEPPPPRVPEPTPAAVTQRPRRLTRTAELPPWRFTENELWRFATATPRPLSDFERRRGERISRARRLSFWLWVVVWATTFPFLALDELNGSYAGFQLKITSASLIGAFVTVALAALFLFLLNRFNWGGMLAGLILGVYGGAIVVITIAAFADTSAWGQKLSVTRVLFVAAAALYSIRAIKPLISS